LIQLASDCRAIDFVTQIQTIRFTIADPGLINALIGTLALEFLSMACSNGRMCGHRIRIAMFLIRSITAIVFTVASPCGGNAELVFTLELAVFGITRIGTLLLIAIVTTIIVPVTLPLGEDAHVVCTFVFIVCTLPMRSNFRAIGLVRSIGAIRL
jgi:hypothetical protein